MFHAQLTTSHPLHFCLLHEIAFLLTALSVLDTGNIFKHRKQSRHKTDNDAIIRNFLSSF